MEITKREVILSVAIVAIMLVLGIIISGKISEEIMDRNEKYNKALKIEDEELFKYAMNTNVGNAFIYGDLKAIDTVTYPEIGGEYLYVEKVKEEYTMHTRTVTYKDSKGKTHSKIETYWTWDYAGSEDIMSKEVTFLNVKFNASQFSMPSAPHIKTIKESSHIRYKYYGVPSKLTCTIFTKLKDGNIEDKDIKIYNGYTISETVDILSSKFEKIIFWVIWIPLICAAIYGFCYLDNRWLNS
jgi:hypothetical protein